MTKKTNEDVIASKQVFTTGEAAKICNVSQQTIIRCFDSGRLLGFKVPGSRFRRIPRIELIRFMKQNGMDIDRLGTGPVRVLVIGLIADEMDSVIKSYSGGHNIQIHHADDAWTAGYLAHKVTPGLILLNPRLVGIDREAMLTSLTNNGVGTPMIVMVDNKFSNGLNVSTKYDDSKDVIKQAVQKLLSA